VCASLTFLIHCTRVIIFFSQPTTCADDLRRGCSGNACAGATDRIMPLPFHTAAACGDPVGRWNGRRGDPTVLRLLLRGQARQQGETDPTLTHEVHPCICMVPGLRSRIALKGRAARTRRMMLRLHLAHQTLLRLLGLRHRGSQRSIV
jgi:hypothetical protein